VYENNLCALRSCAASCFQASAVTFDESWRDTVTMNKTSHTIAMPLSQHDAINNKPRSKGFRILTGNSEYQGVVVVHDNANRWCWSTFSGLILHAVCNHLR